MKAVQICITYSRMCESRLLEAGKMVEVERKKEKKSMMDLGCLQEVTEKYAQYLNGGLLPLLDIKCVSCRIDKPHWPMT